MIRFGVLGAAKIAPNVLIQPCADEDRTEVHCITARDRERAEGFAEEHGIAVVHDSYWIPVPSAAGSTPAGCIPSTPPLF